MAISSRKKKISHLTVFQCRREKLEAGGEAIQLHAPPPDLIVLH